MGWSRAHPPELRPSLEQVSMGNRAASESKLTRTRRESCHAGKSATPLPCPPSVPQSSAFERLAVDPSPVSNTSGTSSLLGIAEDSPKLHDWSDTFQTASVTWLRANTVIAAPGPNGNGVPPGSDALAIFSLRSLKVLDRNGVSNQAEKQTFSLSDLHPVLPGATRVAGPPIPNPAAPGGNPFVRYGPSHRFQSARVMIAPIATTPATRRIRLRAPVLITNVRSDMTQTRPWRCPSRSIPYI